MTAEKYFNPIHVPWPPSWLKDIGSINQESQSPPVPYDEPPLDSPAEQPSASKAAEPKSIVDGSR